MKRPLHARHSQSPWASLFRAPEPSRLSPTVIAVAYGGSLPLLVLVALLRQSGVAATNTVWAEDGAVFYHQAVLHSWVGTLLTPYAGYFQLFPLRDMADVTSIVGSTSLAVLALYVFHVSRGILPPLWARLLLVGGMVLLPLATGELLDNVVNVPWWLFFAAFWALLARPRTAGGIVAATLVCVLATGSDPLVGLLVPLAVVRGVVLRSWSGAVPVIGFGLGLAFQVVGVARAGGRNSAFSAASVHGIAQSFGLRVGWGSLTGNDLTNRLIASHQVTWTIIGYVIPAAIVIGAILSRDRPTITFVSVSLLFAAVTFVVPVWVRGVGPTMAVAPVVIGGRYSATPILLVVGALLAVAAQLAKREFTIARMAAPLVCCIVLVPIWILDFRPTNLRSAGPAWSSQVARSAARCAADPHRPRILHIDPAGWQVVLPCPPQA